MECEFTMRDASGEWREPELTSESVFRDAGIAARAALALGFASHLARNASRRDVETMLGGRREAASGCPWWESETELSRFWGYGDWQVIVGQWLPARPLSEAITDMNVKVPLARGDFSEVLNHALNVAHERGGSLDPVE